MSNLVQLRHYLTKYTLDDARAGVQPIKQMIPDKVTGAGSLELFNPPKLQYRAREKIDGAIAWGEWQDVLFVREGDDVGS